MFPVCKILANSVLTSCWTRSCRFDFMPFILRDDFRGGYKEANKAEYAGDAALFEIDDVDDVNDILGCSG